MKINEEFSVLSAALLFSDTLIDGGLHSFKKADASGQSFICIIETIDEITNGLQKKNSKIEEQKCIEQIFNYITLKSLSSIKELKRLNFLKRLPNWSMAFYWQIIKHYDLVHLFWKTIKKFDNHTLGLDLLNMILDYFQQEDNMDIKDLEIYAHLLNYLFILDTKYLIDVTLNSKFEEVNSLENESTSISMNKISSKSIINNNFENKNGDTDVNDVFNLIEDSREVSPSLMIVQRLSNLFKNIIECYTHIYLKNDRIFADLSLEKSNLFLLLVAPLFSLLFLQKTHCIAQLQLLLIQEEVDKTINKLDHKSLDIVKSHKCKHFSNGRFVFNKDGGLKIVLNEPHSRNHNVLKINHIDDSTECNDICLSQQNLDECNIFLNGFSIESCLDKGFENYFVNQSTSSIKLLTNIISRYFKDNLDNKENLKLNYPYFSSTINTNESLKKIKDNSRLNDEKANSLIDENPNYLNTKTEEFVNSIRNSFLKGLTGNLTLESFKYPFGLNYFDLLAIFIIDISETTAYFISKNNGSSGINNVIDDEIKFSFYNLANCYKMEKDNLIFKTNWFDHFLNFNNNQFKLNDNKINKLNQELGDGDNLSKTGFYANPDNLLLCNEKLFHEIFSFICMIKKSEKTRMEWQNQLVCRIAKAQIYVKNKWPRYKDHYKFLLSIEDQVEVKKKSFQDVIRRNNDLILESEDFVLASKMLKILLTDKIQYSLLKKDLIEIFKRFGTHEANEVIHKFFGSNKRPEGEFIGDEYLIKEDLDQFEAYLTNNILNRLTDCQNDEAVLDFTSYIQFLMLQNPWLLTYRLIKNCIHNKCNIKSVTKIFFKYPNLSKIGYRDVLKNSYWNNFSDWNKYSIKNFLLLLLHQFLFNARSYSEKEKLNLKIFINEFLKMNEDNNLKFFTYEEFFMILVWPGMQLFEHKNEICPKVKEQMDGNIDEDSVRIFKSNCIELFTEGGSVLEYGEEDLVRIMSIIHLFLKSLLNFLHPNETEICMKKLFNLFPPFCIYLSQLLYNNEPPNIFTHYDDDDDKSLFFDWSVDNYVNLRTILIECLDMSSTLLLKKFSISYEWFENILPTDDWKIRNSIFQHKLMIPEELKYFMKDFLNSIIIEQNEIENLIKILFQFYLQNQKSFEFCESNFILSRLSQFDQITLQSTVLFTFLLNALHCTENEFLLLCKLIYKILSVNSFSLYSLNTLDDKWLSLSTDCTRDLQIELIICHFLTDCFAILLQILKEKTLDEHETKPTSLILNNDSTKILVENQEYPQHKLMNKVPNAKNGLSNKLTNCCQINELTKITLAKDSNETEEKKLNKNINVDLNNIFKIKEIVLNNRDNNLLIHFLNQLIQYFKDNFLSKVNLLNIIEKESEPLVQYEKSSNILPGINSDFLIETRKENTLIRKKKKNLEKLDNETSKNIQKLDSGKAIMDYRNFQINSFPSEENMLKLKLNFIKDLKDLVLKIIKMLPNTQQMDLAQDLLQIFMMQATQLVDEESVFYKNNYNNYKNIDRNII